MDKNIKILVACEESQVITNSFREKGFEAYSCDILPCSGGHPEWHIQGDVVPILEQKWDMIIAHPPCFIAGTKVMTYNGIKNIEDIRVGDLVLTHTGNYKEVTKTMNKKTYEISTLKAENVGVIKCTPDHPFYVQNVKRIFNSKTRRYEKTPQGFEWKSVRDFNTIKTPCGNVKEQTYIACVTDSLKETPKYSGMELYKNKFTSRISNTLNVSDVNFWYLIGRWLGDGYYYHKIEYGKRNLRGISICCSKKETLKLENKIKLTRFNYKLEYCETVNRFKIYNTELAKYLQQFGDGAENKKIPGFVTRLTDELALHFLNGYFDSDGHYGDRRVSYSSVSSDLAYGIKYMINKYYKTSCSITKCDNTNRTNIMGRICNVKDSYVGTFNIADDANTHYIKQDDYILTQYKLVDTLISNENTTVYNLSVKDDESYTVNGIAVHNCTYLTVTGNKWMKPEFKDRFPNRAQQREEAIKFFMMFANADCEYIAIENPVGIMSSIWRKPNQYVHPYYFGDPHSKKTGLWLKGLPLLKPTKMVEPQMYIYKTGKKAGKGDPIWHVESLKLPPEERSIYRSKTFPGLAEAITTQWGNFLREKFGT